MSKNQCAFWALDQCVTRGGGLVIVMSTHWQMPHLQWISDDERISHFTPFEDLPEAWHSVFGFEGQVRFVDEHRGALTRTAIGRGVIALGFVWAAWEARNAWRWLTKLITKGVK